MAPTAYACQHLDSCTEFWLILGYAQAEELLAVPVDGDHLAIALASVNSYQNINALVLIDPRTPW